MANHIVGSAVFAVYRFQSQRLTERSFTPSNIYRPFLTPLQQTTIENNVTKGEVFQYIQALSDAPAADDN